MCTLHCYFIICPACFSWNIYITLLNCSPRRIDGRPLTISSALLSLKWVVGRTASTASLPIGVSFPQREVGCSKMRYIGRSRFRLEQYPTFWQHLSRVPICCLLQRWWERIILHLAAHLHACFMGSISYKSRWRSLDGAIVRKKIAQTMPNCYIGWGVWSEKLANSLHAWESFVGSMLIDDHIYSGLHIFRWKLGSALFLDG